MNEMKQQIAIAGGGLAGLTAALYLARAGNYEVVVYEKARFFGGRARTQNKNGFNFNRGPHALYAQGVGMQILDELKIPWSGEQPGIDDTYFIDGGVVYHNPFTDEMLDDSTAFSPEEKTELSRVRAALGSANPYEHGNVSFREWLETETKLTRVRRYMEGMARLGTFDGNPEELSADAVMAQWQIGGGGVYYIDGGWQSLVAGLYEAAVEEGVVFRSASRLRKVQRQENGLRVFHGEDSEGEFYDALILACERKETEGLLEQLGVSLPGERNTLRAACLDLGLAEVNNLRTLHLDFDRYLYAQQPSNKANLAPEGMSLLQVTKYLKQGEDGAGARGEMEALLNELEPGWREHVLEEQFLPDIAVVGAMPNFRSGGLRGRPTSILKEAPGVYLAGDWVGPEGLLADAAFASAREAARGLVEALEQKLRPGLIA